MSGMIINPFIVKPAAPVAVNTIALLHMDGTNGASVFPDDNVANTWGSGIGGFTTSTVVTPVLGTASALGNTTALISSGAISLGSGDWTIEMFIYPTLSGSYDILGWTSGSHIGGLFVSTTVRFAYNNNAVFSPDTGPALPANTWTHFAMVKTLTDTFTMFINGIAQTPITGLGAFIDPNAPLHIGNAGEYGHYNGNIDELRISNIARYSGNFTPTAVPFVLD